MAVVDIDCGDCAKCCRWFYKNARPGITEEEITRISELTGKTREQIAEPRKKSTPEDMILKFDDDYWCPFISFKGKGGKCTIWGNHPIECSLYPIFPMVDKSTKLIGIDLECPKCRETIDIDLTEIKNNQSLFHQERPPNFSRMIVLKGVIDG